MEGLTKARLLVNACFLGGNQLCGHLPQRCTEKNSGKIVYDGKCHFTGFIMVRIIGVTLLMVGDTVQSLGNVSIGEKAALKGDVEQDNHSDPPAWS